MCARCARLLFASPRLSCGLLTQACAPQPVCPEKVPDVPVSHPAVRRAETRPLAGDDGPADCRVHEPDRRDHRQRRPSWPAKGVQRHQQPDRMGGCGLYPCFCSWSAALRASGRYRGTPPHVRLGGGGVHAGLGPVRACPHHRNPCGRPRAAGGRRGDDDAADPCHRADPVRAEGTRCRLCPVRSVCRTGRSHRPGAGWLSDRAGYLGAGLAADLSGEHPRRHRRHSCRPALCARSSGIARAAQ